VALLNCIQTTKGDPAVSLFRTLHTTLFQNNLNCYQGKQVI